MLLTENSPEAQVVTIDNTDLNHVVSTIKTVFVNTHPSRMRLKGLLTVIFAFISSTGAGVCEMDT